ncbi:MAG: DUF433 domain-containing protein [Algoriphagus sp.]
MDYKKYIGIDPNIRFGKPYLKNTGITVADVLGWMASGMSRAEIVGDFPGLTLEQVSACLAFAADKEQKLSYV